jgi:hypothetical protein
MSTSNTVSNNVNPLRVNGHLFSQLSPKIFNQEGLRGKLTTLAGFTFVAEHSLSINN